MKYDEFAFFNQQLAAMLRENIPLEGALKQLCQNLGRGRLRSEIELLEGDLSRGLPLKEALAARKLPDFYVKMVEAGVAANDLPAVLLMLADYYQNANVVWTRLKGLMVYPILVLLAAFALSAFICLLGQGLIQGLQIDSPFIPAPNGLVLTSLWAPPIFTGLLLVTTVALFITPGWRKKLRWRLPAFRDAHLAQVARTMGFVLQRGGNLDEAISIVSNLESGTRAEVELREWHKNLSAGRGRFAEFALPGSAFPPMFIWLVSNTGENLAEGFRRTAEIYGARASRKTDMLLLAALPCSIVLLGFMIIGQILPVARVLTSFINSIGG